MYDRFREHLDAQLQEIDRAGMTKHERLITTAQGAHVGVKSGDVLNLCANNYLGLAQHPEVNAAAAKGLQEWGYGMASVRFICGTQTLHKELRRSSATFSAPRTPYSIPPVSMPTADCLKPCWTLTTRLFQTN